MARVAPRRARPAPEYAATGRLKGGWSPFDSTWFAVALGLVAATPVLGAAARLIAWGWVPISDEGVIATRAFDVWSTRSPLLGQATTSVDAASGLARSPGPMQYWLYSLPSRLGPTWACIAVGCAVSVACFVGAVVLARRRGGPVLAVAVSLGLVLVTRAVNPKYLVTLWNPAAGLSPFILLFFLCWSVGAGEVRLLPLTLGVASFVGQDHLTFLIPAIPMSALALLGGFAPWLWSQRRLRRPRLTWPGSTEVRALFGGLAVVVACWAAPLYQQFFSPGPGNLTLLMGASGTDVERAGYLSAWNPVSQSIGWPPRFISAPVSSALYFFGQGYFPSSTRFSAGVLLGALALLGANALLRRDRNVAMGAAMVLVMVPAGLFVAASTPKKFPFTIHYTLLWLVPLGLFVWLIGALGLAALLREWAGHHRTAQPWIPRAHAVVSVAVVVAVALVLGIGATPFDDQRELYPVSHRLGDAASREVRLGQRYLVTASSPFSNGLLEGVAYRLRRAGASPILDGLGPSFGDRYLPSARRCAGVVTLEVASPSQPRRLPRGGRLLSAQQVRGSVVTLVMTPDRGRPSC